MYVHSQVSAIKMNSASYTGGIYAPNTALEGDQGNGNGNGNGGGGGCGGGSTAIKGSVIVENFCFRNGNFDYVESMGSLEVEVDLDTITYLHVSESRVEVDLT